jgi:hypothetical protein
MLEDHIANVFIKILAENNDVMSVSEIEQQFKLIVGDSIEYTGYTCRSIIFDRPHLFTVHFPNILDWVVQLGPAEKTMRGKDTVFNSDLAPIEWTRVSLMYIPIGYDVERHFSKIGRIKRWYDTLKGYGYV